MPLQASIDVPRKAARILRDYVLDLYFPAQRLTWPQRVRCLPVLFLVEYLVYRVDAIAEHGQDLDLDPAAPDQDTARRYRSRLDAYRVRFETLLRSANAYNEAAAIQLKLGEEYVYLENKVTSTRTVTAADVLHLAELRPSDVRLLHAMTYALLGRPVDQRLLDLLWPVEVLADIANDLDHYASDIAAGRYNTYDAFVRLYGRSAPEQLRVAIAAYEQRFHAELAQFPANRQASLAVLCARRYLPRIEAIPEPRLLPDGR
jgi:hypothetical protein